MNSKNFSDNEIAGFMKLLVYTQPISSHRSLINNRTWASIRLEPAFKFTTCI